MASWSITPRTWVAGEVLSSAEMNAQLRDFQRSTGVRTGYTPAWTGSTTNPVLGVGGGAVGRWARTSQDVRGQVLILAGAATTFGSGNYSISLPYPVYNFSNSTRTRVGEGAIYVAGVLIPVIAYCNALTTPTQAYLIDTGGGLIIGSSTPGGWASGATLEFSFEYEAA